MPDCMRIGVFIPHIKECSDGVEYGADDDEYHHGLRQVIEKSSSADDHDPAHGQIDEGRDQLVFSGCEYFEDGACRCEGPEDDQQGVAKAVSHVYEEERGVGSGDEKEYADMVEDLEDASQRRFGGEMKDGGHGECHQKAESINT